MTDNNAVVAATSTKIETFNNPSFGSVRVSTDENGEPWFVAADVARVLDYRTASDAIRYLDDDEANTLKQRIRSENGVEQERQMLIINESGLYNLIFRSRKPEAKKFRKWVTEEVLPSIRKTGSYSITKNPVDVVVYSDNPLERCKALTAILEKQEEEKLLLEQQKHIAEQERDDVKEAFSRSVVSDNDKLYSTFIKELKMTNPCASSLLKELKIFGKTGHLSDYGDWFKIKVSDNGFPARFVTKLGQEMLIKLFNNNRDKMRAINGTYRYIKPQDRFKVIPEIEYM